MYFDKNYLKNLTKPIINKDEKWTSHWTELIWNPENIFARIRWLNRIKSKSNRTWVFRAILKNTFIKNWWFNPQKWYFDDDLSKIWKALFVKNAICFHNNPETLWEIYKHSQRVWKSFAKNKKILISYLKKYISIIILFIIILIFLFALFIIIIQITKHSKISCSNYYCLTNNKWNISNISTNKDNQYINILN